MVDCQQLQEPLLIHGPDVEAVRRINTDAFLVRKFQKKSLTCQIGSDRQVGIGQQRMRFPVINASLNLKNVCINDVGYARFQHAITQVDSTAIHKPQVLLRPVLTGSGNHRVRLKVTIAHQLFGGNLCLLKPERHRIAIRPTVFRIHGYGQGIAIIQQSFRIRLDLR